MLYADLDPLMVSELAFQRDWLFVAVALIGVFAAGFMLVVKI